MERERKAVLLVFVALALPLSYSGTVAAQTPAPDPVLLAAGDISSCGNDNDEATATLLDALAGTAITLGDNVYDTGTADQFSDCYNPTWGRHKSRTRPAPGNHDYYTANATGYYNYFGAAAGDPAKGYYSYDLGAWHSVAINSNDNCTIIPCGAGSAQEQWLRADLAANASACTLAYWHHPRFSSGSQHGNTGTMEPIWQALYDYGADVVLSGHEHNYERFAKQTASGAADPTQGIREFVVGTGGKSHYSFGAPKPNSEVQNGDTYGVLKLTLHASGYDWQFIPVAGQTFTDSGSDSCHGAPTGVGGATSLPTAAPDTSTAPVSTPGDSGGMARAWIIAAGAVAALVVGGALLVARRHR